MKVEYTQTIRTASNGHVSTQFEESHVLECCEEMREAWKEEHIGLLRGPETRAASVCIDFQSNGYYGEVDHDRQAITFCPFFGTRIELLETERIELVEKIVKKKEVVERDLSVWMAKPNPSDEE